MAKESAGVNDTLNHDASSSAADEENRRGMDNNDNEDGVAVVVVSDNFKENMVTEPENSLIAKLSCESKASSENNDNDNTNDTNEQQQVTHERPVKRARTAYFIFAEEKRPEIQKQHPGEGVAVVARAIGALWGSLTEEQKKPYQEQAAAEREQVKLAVEAWKKAGGIVPEALVSASTDNNNNTGSDGDPTLIFPVARIRKICKLDPEVRGLSKEALLILTKAAELALIKLSKECVKTAAIQNRRKLLAEDVASVCSTREQFLFLQPDIQDLHKSQQQQQQQQQTGGSNGVVATQSKKKGAPSTEQEAASKHCKPLTNYFAVRKTESES